MGLRAFSIGASALARLRFIPSNLTTSKNDFEVVQTITTGDMIMVWCGVNYIPAVRVITSAMFVLVQETRVVRTTLERSLGLRSCRPSIVCQRQCSRALRIIFPTVETVRVTLCLLLRSNVLFGSVFLRVPTAVLKAIVLRRRNKHNPTREVCVFLRSSCDGLRSVGRGGVPRSARLVLFHILSRGCVLCVPTARALTIKLFSGKRM